MDSVVSVISSWKDLIIKVFGEYPLSAAFVTVLAIGAGFLLEKKIRPGKISTNILMVLLGWAILVPIVGFVLTILGKLWDFIAAVAPIVTTVLGSFYAIYAKHPFIVGALCFLALIAYFAWKKWWPRLLQSRGLRILTLVVLTVLIAHIVSPVANILSPEPAPAETKPTAPATVLPVNAPAPAPPSPSSAPVK